MLAYEGKSGFIKKVLELDGDLYNVYGEFLDTFKSYRSQRKLICVIFKLTLKLMTSLFTIRVWGLSPRINFI